MANKQGSLSVLQTDGNKRKGFLAFAEPVTVARNFSFHYFVFASYVSQADFGVHFHHFEKDEECGSRAA